MVKVIAIFGLGLINWDRRVVWWRKAWYSRQQIHNYVPDPDKAM